MRESTDRVQLALHGDDPDGQRVASRLVQNPAAFRTWENEHSSLMREVAGGGPRRTQIQLLKKTAIRLAHRKAPFEYLRDGQVRGSMRMRMVESFHPASDYAQSVVSEHRLYLRTACSFMCASHVGTDVVMDPGFFDPMKRYEELYAEYFQSFCVAHFSGSGSGADADLQKALMPLLKHQLEECRNAIMNPGPGTDWLIREAERRAPSGDTVRLPRLR